MKGRLQKHNRDEDSVFSSNEHELGISASFLFLFLFWQMKETSVDAAS